MIVTNSSSKRNAFLTVPSDSLTPKDSVPVSIIIFSTVVSSVYKTNIINIFINTT